MSGRPYIGFRQLDIMDSLSEKRMTVSEISEDTGMDRDTVDSCMQRLKAASLIRCMGRSKLARRPKLWQLSAKGKRSLADELSRGAIPGVPMRRQRRARTKRTA